ncbi:MAG: hypothetical protein IT204_06410 [Fimbriimonadaceae bacterium]|nr:hypothetical protein [Fimbriimonadaceae bacterium]
MTERTWVYFALLAVSLVIGGVLLREPLLEPYRAMQAEALANQRKAGELKTELLARRAASSKQGNVLARFGEELDAAGRRRRATQVYRQVEAMVTASGLLLDSIQPKPDQLDGDGLLRFPVVLSARGTDAQVVALLGQIQSTTTLLVAERLTMQRRDDAQAPVAVQVTVVAYGVADRETRDRLAAERAKKTQRSRGDGNNET